MPAKFEQRKWVLWTIAVIVYLFSLFSMIFFRKMNAPDIERIIQVRNEILTKPHKHNTEEKIFWAIPVDINRVTRDDLMMIKGIGRKKAEAILRLREYRGRIRTFGELLELDEINMSDIAKMKQYIDLK